MSSDGTEIVKDVLSVVGGVLGTLAFIWKILDTFISFLHLDLKVESANLGGDKYAPTALVTVENKGALPKKINYAALLIGPEGDGLKETAEKIAQEISPDAKGPRRYLQTIINSKLEKPIYTADKRAGLIPLPFFFRSQSQIGNETIKHRRTIDVNGLESQKTYVVTFIVLIRYPYGLIRARVTSDLLILR